MTKTEAAVLSVAIVSATVASCLGGLTEPLVGIISVSIGYGGGRVAGNKIGGSSSI